MRINKIILIIILTVLFISAVWFLNIKILLADHYLKEAIAYRKGNSWPVSLVNYEKVLFYQPKEPYYQQSFANNLLSGLDFYKSNDSKIKILDLAISQMKKIPERDQVFEVKTYLARIYSQKANLTKNQNDFLLAENAFKQAAEISPKMAAIYNDWCQLKIYQENWPQALEMCEKSFSLYPDLNNPQMNNLHREMVKSELSTLYDKFGQIYFSLKDYKKSEEMYVQVLELVPLSRPDVWKKIADIYYIQGDLDTAIQKNMHGYDLNPKDLTWPLAIAVLYQEKGNLEMARQYGQKALKLSPDNVQIKNFLENLK
ncbi:MAG: tetratricopeptide repeat protein [Patescibacteria group bacterium]|nr:tetratricopeptide repeat protein [Patescibacteria group bacterium]